MTGLIKLLFMMIMLGKRKGVEIKEPWRAEGLEKVLYKCPSCLAEGEMKGRVPF